MSNELEKERQENFNNMKIGFLLELWFRQNMISEQLRTFIVFLEDNKDFFKNIDLSCMVQGISDFIGLFYSFTDLIFRDVDFDEVHCKYHKDFY